MAYNATYNKEDFQAIVVDGLGTAGAGVISWIELIILFLVLGLLAGLFLKLRNVFK
jgi:hypothetical protein